MRKSVTYRRPEQDSSGCHALLWVDTARVRRGGAAAGPAVVATARRLWPVGLTERTVMLGSPVEWEGPGQLLELLCEHAPKGLPLTLWLQRGWESLALSGLAELMEEGALRWGRLALDGERVILRGKLGRHPLRVTSLTAWTGGSWDAWRGKVESGLDWLTAGSPESVVAQALAGASEGERLALATVLAVLRGCGALAVGPPALAMGAQARRWWASWGGRTLRDEGHRPADRRTRKRPPVRRIVIPHPRRPRAAALAEAHVAHGLVREQYCRGHVGGPVHVLDLAQAYLLALALVDLPATYDRTVAAMAPADLHDYCRRGTACALCRLEGAAAPVVQWRDRKPRRLVGDLWAWLSGADLVTQLATGAVTEVHTAHLWRALRHAPLSRDCLLSVRQRLVAEVGEWVLPFWRGLYSAIAGTWNQSAYRWVDCQKQFRSARWATFVYPGAAEGEVDHYRVVGGRVQRREYLGEAAHACPIAYAAVTAMVRSQVDCMRGALPAGGVLAVACDALWLTDGALRALRESTDSVAEREGRWTVKESWDDAWLDGHGRAVVRKGDILYPLTAGVPSAEPLGADGYARWVRAEPWGASPDAAPGRPRLKVRARWDGGKVVRENDGPLTAVDPWLTVRERDLHEDLLLPFDPHTTGSNYDGQDGV